MGYLLTTEPEFEEDDAHRERPGWVIEAEIRRESFYLYSEHGGSVEIVYEDLPRLKRILERIEERRGQ